MGLRRNSTLFPAVEADIAALSAFVVERCLQGVEPSWREVVREFSDERSYLSLFLATDAGASVPSVRIEFGVQDGAQRHATGGLTAEWVRTHQVLGAIDAVLLDRQPAEIDRFVDRLQGLLDLLCTIGEEVVGAIAE